MKLTINITGKDNCTEPTACNGLLLRDVDGTEWRVAAFEYEPGVSADASRGGGGSEGKALRLRQLLNFLDVFAGRLG